MLANLSLKADYLAPLFRQRLKRANSRNELQLKALGNHKARFTHIIDATAGLGYDALLFASLGYTVTLIERSTPVATLLQQSWLAAQSFPPFNTFKVNLVNGDAITLLPTLPPADVIYLDPMFPVLSRQSALNKQRLRQLRELVGDDNDAPQLLAAARLAATQRVIVKTRKRAHYLSHDKPDYSLTGKSQRYDIYLSKS